MSWSKLDDSLSDHPKAVDAGPALALWTRALAWCARHHSDGAIPSRVALSLSTCLASDPFVSASPIDLCERLVAVGLWDATETGYAVHDFGDYHESRAEWQAKCAAEAARKRRERGVSCPPSGRTEPGQASVVRPESERTPRARVRGPARPSPSPSPRSESEADRTSPARSDPATPAAPQDVTPLAAFVGSVWPDARTIPEAAWRDAYPAVDLLAEARSAYAWEQTQPAARRKRDHRRFLDGWLRRAQERAATSRAGPAQTTLPTTRPPSHAIWKGTEP